MHREMQQRQGHRIGSSCLCRILHRDEQLAESPELEQPNDTEEKLQAETEGASASASETDPDATTKAGA